MVINRYPKDPIVLPEIPPEVTANFPVPRWPLFEVLQILGFMICREMFPGAVGNLLGWEN